MLSVKSGRQALKLCFYAAVIIVVEVLDQLRLEVLHRLKLLQIQQLTFEQAEEIFNHGIVQTVSPSTHALVNAPDFEHPLVLLVLVLPTLVGVQDETGSVWELFQSLVQHFCHHGQHRPV